MNLSTAKATPFGVALLLALAVEGIGGWLTVLGPWYEGLQKPAWQPPGWLFPPVWTILFVMIGVSAGLAWTHAREGERSRIVMLFALNALLNVAWSFLFFRAQRPDWAFFEVVPFWASIVALIVVLRPVSRTASLLLVPYLAWVSFAAFLNVTVARLNGYL